MEINQDMITHLLSSSGGAGAVLGAGYLAIKRLISRLDKLERKVDEIEMDFARISVRFETLLDRGYKND